MRQSLDKPEILGSLKYVTREGLALRRVRQGGRFVYFNERRRVTDKKTLDRIAKMALPPAWTDVRICKSPNGHLQALGRDQRGRWQYRYHERWTVLRNEKKFGRMVAFGEKLPLIRKKVKEHLSKPGFSREKVLAAAVDILQRTNMRVGNDIYARTNGSYGLTTIRNRHAKVQGKKVKFHYRSKSGKIRDIEFEDPVLSRIIRRCQDLPGEELFCYEEGEGKVRDITSTDVNAYIKEISGEDFTAKDFRTWCGTLRALELLAELGECEKLKDREWRGRHLQVIRATAECLGNTPSICEKYYIHPEIFAADRSHKLFKRERPRRIAGLTPVECTVMELIKFKH